MSSAALPVEEATIRRLDRVRDAQIVVLWGPIAMKNSRLRPTDLSNYNIF
jgi:hypothetical protein